MQVGPKDEERLLIFQAAELARRTLERGVRAADVIAIEDLRVANMTRSARGSLEAPGTNVAVEPSVVPTDEEEEMQP